SKSEVAERKTRFEQTTESEEVIINQDDYENDDENSGIEDTDNYATKTAPHRSKLTQMTQPYIGFPSESNRLPLTTIQENDFSTSDMQRQHISHDSLNFNRVLPQSALGRRNDLKHKSFEDDNSSLSPSDDDYQENSVNLQSNMKKTKLFRKNVDLNNINARKSKKKVVVETNINQTDDRYEALKCEVQLMKKRLLRLEKVYATLKKNKQLEKKVLSAVSDPSSLDFTQKIKSGHEPNQWRKYIEPNQSVLQDEDMPLIWFQIIKSMEQYPYDVKIKNTKKKSTAITTASSISISKNIDTTEDDKEDKRNDGTME
ncbi:unnamed protein product, partial [Didymodactylos carnosus]